jgi:hypothetical protein
LLIKAGKDEIVQRLVSMMAIPREELREEPIPGRFFSKSLTASFVAELEISAADPQPDKPVIFRVKRGGKVQDQYETVLG